MGILETLGLRKKKVEESAKGKTIKVGPRETLRSIAKKYYDDEGMYLKLLDTNRWRIDGDEVVPGQDLLLPYIPGKSKFEPD